MVNRAATERIRKIFSNGYVTLHFDTFGNLRYVEPQSFEDGGMWITYLKQKQKSFGDITMLAQFPLCFCIIHPDWNSLPPPSTFCGSTMPEEGNGREIPANA